MTPVALPDTMSPAQRQGWLTLLNLARAFPDGWCLVGGQMVWLLAAEHHARPPRTTDDVDIVADIRAEPARIQELCRWLEDNGLGLQGISPEGIGHRYARAASPGPGDIMVDVLAIDNIGPRANLSTTRGARTVQATGSRRLPPPSGRSLAPRSNNPARDVTMTRHQQGFPGSRPSGPSPHL